MAKKPNYSHERAQKTRAKNEKKQEKLRRRQEESERRKSSGDAQPDPTAEAGTE